MSQSKFLKDIILFDMYINERDKRRIKYEIKQIMIFESFFLIVITPILNRLTTIKQFI